jgi:hypothetical protein
MSVHIARKRMDLPPQPLGGQTGAESHTDQVKHRNGIQDRKPEASELEFQGRHLSDIACNQRRNVSYSQESACCEATT